MWHRNLVIAGSIGAAAALAACSSTSTTSPGSGATQTQISSDVAEAAASDVGSSMADLGGTETIAGASSVVMRPLVERMIPPGGVSVRFDQSCTIGEMSGHATFPANDPRDTASFARQWEFFSAHGCENHLASDSTDSVAFAFADTLYLNGKHEHWHAHHYAARSHGLTGDSTGAGTLLSASGIHVWNGNAAVLDTATFSDTTSSGAAVTAAYQAVASDTAKNVTFPHPRNGDLYPISGAWTRWVNGTAQFSGGTTGTASFSRHIVVTFSATSGQGSSQAQLQVFNAVSGALIKTCLVDLSEDEIVPGSCH
jgi:hypothetical protein